ncbi:response regulator transcription factor [Serratia proteamaculans]|uniref:response regulator transcription factor n=1 Tax=Serratia proteamaculans TaxID=28151 RepID=UPI0010769764|nr:response regulator transcription factor [Serratia proteamaculans]TFZ50994.1 response regulator transcription factor [Serratia proteamaculans]
MEKTLAIADRHPLIVHALTQLLQQQPGIRVVHSSRCAQQLAQQLTAEPVDMVIADEQFLLQEKLSGPGHLLLRRYLQQGKLVVLTDGTPQHAFGKLLELGARVLVSKQDSPEVNLQALHHALAHPGESYFSPSVHATLEQATLNKINGHELTGKELEVIRLLASGISLVQIAKMKNRSVSTVATHKYNAMRKLDIHSNAELIRYAVDSHIS